MGLKYSLKFTAYSPTRSYKTRQYFFYRIEPVRANLRFFLGSSLEWQVDEILVDRSIEIEFHRAIIGEVKKYNFSNNKLHLDGTTSANELIIGWTVLTSEAASVYEILS